MKKILLTLISFVLILSMTACELVGTHSISKNGDEAETEAATTSDGVAYVDKPRADFNGIWYSFEMASAFIITDAGVKIDELTYGYYEYENVVDCVATYDGSRFLTLTIDDSSLRLGFTEDGKLTAVEYSYALTKMEAEPTKHVTYAFPDLTQYGSVLTMDKTTFEAAVATQMDIYRTECLLNLWSNYYLDLSKEEGDEENVYPVSTKTVAAKGDYINFDYSGRLDGETEPFDGGTSEDVDALICDNSGYIPGFIDGIIGHTVGETFDVTVVFPTTYTESLAGKTAVFTMKLNAIYDTTIIPAMLDTYESEDAYVKAQLLDEAEDFFYDIMLDCAEYTDIPEAVYMFFKAYYSDQAHYYAWSYGVDYETFVLYGYYSGYDYSDAGLTEQGITQAAKALCVYATATALGRTITDDERTQELNDLIASYVEGGYNEADVREYYENEMEATQLHYFLTADIFLDYLVETYIK